ncbi:MAG TPA: hypothetical protein ACQGQH_04745 [Xylella sp.]
MRPRILLQSNHLRYLFEPRKPRHPLTRMLVSTAGLAILAILVFFGLFIGTAMLIGGIAWKLLLGQRQRIQASSGTNTIEGKYQLIRKPEVPHHINDS